MEKKTIREHGNYFGVYKLDGMSFDALVAHFQYEFDQLAERGVTDAKLDWDGEDFMVVGYRLETDDEYNKRVYHVEEAARIAKEARYKKYLELHKEFGE